MTFEQAFLCARHTLLSVLTLVSVCCNSVVCVCVWGGGGGGGGVRGPFLAHELKLLWMAGFPLVAHGLTYCGKLRVLSWPMV